MRHWKAQQKRGSVRSNSFSNLSALGLTIPRIRTIVSVFDISVYFPSRVFGDSGGDIGNFPLGRLLFQAISAVAPLGPPRRTEHQNSPRTMFPIHFSSFPRATKYNLCRGRTRNFYFGVWARGEYPTIFILHPRPGSDVFQEFLDS